MQLVTIYREFNATEADLKRARLEAAGFHPLLINENVTMWGAPITAGGISVQVPEGEAADAKEFLNAPPVK